jgi:CRISPR-associated protein Csb2
MGFGMWRSRFGTPCAGFRMRCRAIGPRSPGPRQARRYALRKLAGPARVWISATPYIATRFPKARGRKKDPLDLLGLDNPRSFSRQVLQEELERLCQGSPDMKKPQSIEYLNEEHRMGAHRLRPIQFKRFRRRRSDDGGRRPAGAFRIVFPEPVLGPLCLGTHHTSASACSCPERISIHENTQALLPRP